MGAPAGARGRVRAGGARAGRGVPRAGDAPRSQQAGDEAGPYASAAPPHRARPTVRARVRGGARLRRGAPPAAQQGAGVVSRRAARAARQADAAPRPPLAPRPPRAAAHAMLTRGGAGGAGAAQPEPAALVAWDEAARVLALLTAARDGDDLLVRGGRVPGDGPPRRRPLVPRRALFLRRARTVQVRKVVRDGVPAGASDPDFHDWTALHFAADKGAAPAPPGARRRGAGAGAERARPRAAGHAEAVRVLLAMGASPHVAEALLGNTPLHLAAHQGRKEVRAAQPAAGRFPNAPPPNLYV